MDDITLYFCDPNKNKDCPKTSCYTELLGVCKSTSNPEYAFVDLDAFKASITKVIGEQGEYTIEKIFADDESYIKQFQISERGQKFLIKALEGVHQVEEALGEYYDDKYGF